jgi:hypothetical protein
MDEFVSKKKVASLRNICRLEHAALKKSADDGKVISQMRIDLVLCAYEHYLKMLRLYSFERAREVRHEEKQERKTKDESPDRIRKTRFGKKLPHGDDVAETA